MIAELLGQDALDELDAVPGELKGPLESAFPAEATMIREQLGDEFFRVSILVRNFSGSPSSTGQGRRGGLGSRVAAYTSPPKPDLHHHTLNLVSET